MSGFLCLVFIKKYNENRSLKCKPETTLVSILQFLRIHLIRAFQ